MLRIAEYFFDRPLLDDLAAKHHQHAITQLPHHRQVVGNKQHGEAKFGAQPRQQIQQLRLNRDVEA